MSQALAAWHRTPQAWRIVLAAVGTLAIVWAVSAGLPSPTRCIPADPSFLQVQGQAAGQAAAIEHSDGVWLIAVNAGGRVGVWTTGMSPEPESSRVGFTLPANEQARQLSEIGVDVPRLAPIWQMPLGRAAQDRRAVARAVKCVAASTPFGPAPGFDSRSTSSLPAGGADGLHPFMDD